MKRHRTAGRAAALVPLACAWLAAGAGGARADEVDLLSQTYDADAGATGPAGATAALEGPTGFGGGLIEGPIAVTAPTDGVFSISVADLGLVGDVFEVLLDGASLGTTAPVAVGGPTLSSGVFTAPVAAGFHYIDVWDFIQTYVGYDSPYGGAVTFDYADTGVSVAVTLATGGTALPAPGAAPLAASLALLALARRRGSSEG